MILGMDHCVGIAALSPCFFHASHPGDTHQGAEPLSRCSQDLLQWKVIAADAELLCTAHE